MELLVKETLALGKKRDILFPYYVGYTFFKENNYQGKITHKEAILAYLNYLSRLAKTNLWSSKKREETGKPVDCEMYVAKFRELNSDSIIYTENIRGVFQSLFYMYLIKIIIFIRLYYSMIKK